MKHLGNFNTIWLSLTYDCNNRCEWCYSASNFSNNRKKVLDSAQEDSVIKLINSLGVRNLILIGGEPTVHPRLLDIIRKFDDSNLKVGMVTNGRRLSSKFYVKNLKDSGLKSVTISIEGHNAELHEKTTNVYGSFSQAIRGIENSVDAGIRTASNTNISRLNIDHLEKIVGVLAGKGLEAATFNLCGPSISEERNNDYMVSFYEGTMAFLNVYHKASSMGLRTSLVTPVPLCVFDPDIIGEVKENKIASGGPCQLVHGKNFVVDYNGDILPCTHLTGFPLFNLFQEGEIMSKNKFLDSYNGNGPSGFRNDMNRYPSEKCDPCEEYCAGGCPLFWLKLDPEKEIKGVPNAKGNLQV